MSEAKPNLTVASFPDQLKRAFVPGTAERAKVKHFAHAANKWSLALLIPGLIVWFVWGALPDIKAAWGEQEETRTAAVKQAAVQQKVEEVQKTYTIVVTNDKWTTVTIPPKKCLRASSDQPHVEDYRTRVIRVNTSKEIDLPVYLAAVKAGTIPDNDVGWARLQATGADVAVHYTFYPAPCIAHTK
jgi:hypothetical protein